MPTIQLPDEEELAENKELAGQVLTSFQQSESLILQQQFDLFKWLVASLLLLNGGAATTILNNENVELIHKLASCGAFSIGIVLALLVAVASQKTGQKALKPLGSVIGYWMTVKADGLRNEEIEIERNDELAKSIRYSWLVPAVGLLSGIAFLVGATLAGLGMSDAAAKGTVERMELQQVD